MMEIVNLLKYPILQLLIPIKVPMYVEYNWNVGRNVFHPRTVRSDFVFGSRE